MDAFEELRKTIAESTARREADRTAGRARIGGLFEAPDYLRSYLSAAKALVNKAGETDSYNDLAVAILYLQRHAVELALKTLIGMLHAVADNEQELAKLTGVPITREMPSKGERDRLSTEHDLSKLLADLVKARQREIDSGGALAEIPAGLTALVGGFSKLEKNEPSRLRYPHVKVTDPKRKTKKVEESFPKSIAVPVRDLQTQLEALVEELFGLDDDRKDCLSRDLDDTLQGQNQRLFPLMPSDEPLDFDSDADEA